MAGSCSRWVRRVATFLLVGVGLLWVLSSVGMYVGGQRGSQGLFRVELARGQAGLIDRVNWSSRLYTPEEWDAEFPKEQVWHFFAEWGDPRRLSLGQLDSMKFVRAVTNNFASAVRWDDGGPGSRIFMFPLWIPVAGLAAIVVPLQFLERLRRRLNVAGRCAGCGYDMRATPKRCPECGLEAGSCAQ